MYVANYGGPRVTSYSLALGDPASPSLSVGGLDIGSPEFVRPQDVAVSLNGVNLYVVDSAAGVSGSGTCRVRMINLEAIATGFTTIVGEDPGPGGSCSGAARAPTLLSRLSS